MLSDSHESTGRRGQGTRDPVAGADSMAMVFIVGPIGLAFNAGTIL